MKNKLHLPRSIGSLAVAFLCVFASMMFFPKQANAQKLVYALGLVKADTPVAVSSVIHAERVQQVVSAPTYALCSDLAPTTCDTPEQIAFLSNRGSMGSCTGGYISKKIWLNYGDGNPPIYGQCQSNPDTANVQAQCEGWGQTGYSVRYETARLLDNATCV